MDIQEYIASGKLELYVLDLLPPLEKEEVFNHARQFPEIAKEIESLELGLEQFAQLHAISPPKGTYLGIKERIERAATQGSDLGSTPKTKPLYFLLTALALLAAVVLGLLVQRSNLVSELENSRRELVELQSSCAEKEAKNAAIAQQLAIFQAKGNTTVSLAGSELSPNSFATVIYNSNTTKVYFSPDDLPAPPTGKQYQLWALVDGSPVSMGTVALDAEPGAFVEFPFVNSVGAFAITLEDEGGKPTPDLSQLYVIGEV